MVLGGGGDGGVEEGGGDAGMGVADSGNNTRPLLVLGGVGAEGTGSLGRREALLHSHEWKG